DLAEAVEVRVVGTKHVEDRPALVRDPLQRNDLHAVDLRHETTSFRQVNASASPLGEFDSIPRRLSIARKRSSVNHPLSRCVAKWESSVSTFRLDASSLIGTETFGVPTSPSYFGISYSRTRWFRNVFQVSSQTRRWS